METISISLDEHQADLINNISSLSNLSREQLLDRIFKIGLIDAVMFHANEHGDVELARKANDYMAKDIPGIDFTVDDLQKLWE